MSDIREVLRGLSNDDRALYTEIRTTMRKTYMATHARLLRVDRWEVEDDAFLDMIDIKIAMLFDRAGIFDHSTGSIDTEKATEVETELETAATRMIKQPLEQKQPWPVQNKVN